MDEVLCPRTGTLGHPKRPPKILLLTRAILHKDDFWFQSACTTCYPALRKQAILYTFVIQAIVGWTANYHDLDEEVLKKLTYSPMPKDFLSAPGVIEFLHIITGPTYSRQIRQMAMALILTYEPKYLILPSTKFKDSYYYLKVIVAQILHYFPTIVYPVLKRIELKQIYLNPKPMAYMLFSRCPQHSDAKIQYWRRRLYGTKCHLQKPPILIKPFDQDPVFSYVHPHAYENTAIAPLRGKDFFCLSFSTHN